jgi:hypothetical protein
MLAVRNVLDCYCNHLKDGIFDPFCAQKDEPLSRSITITSHQILYNLSSQGRQKVGILVVIFSPG